MVDPKLRIEVDDKSLVKALGTLRGRADIVIARAANRTITTTNKAMSKGVRARYPKVKDGEVKKALFKRKATAVNPTASLTYKSMHENLYKHGYVSPRKIVKTGYGIKPDPKYYKAHVIKGRPKYPLTERPRPFVQMMPNGHVGLFRRKTKDGMKFYKGTHKRNAIEAVQAPALSQMMKNGGVLKETEKVAGEAFLKRLDHEIDWELRK